jgi:putative ABC transport system substrate-binding protein
MKRREVLAVLGSGGLVFAAPSWTQIRGRVARLGLLASASAASYEKEIEALQTGLREWGYAEGENIVIEYRWAEGKLERLPDLAAELVGLKVDIIVTSTGTVTGAAKRATATIPIVFAAAGDPVAAGLVRSLARPGGNLTGSTFFAAELSAKRLDLLKGAFPRVKRVAALINPETWAAQEIFLPSMKEAARALKLKLLIFEARRPGEFEPAFSAMNAAGADAVIVNEETTFVPHARALGEIALKKRLPSIGFKKFGEAGGLMAYGVDIPEMFRRAAYFVNRILKGAKPGDLPIERATKFELIVNLKTAKALGLAVPQSLLLRADQVIE